MMETGTNFSPLLQQVNDHDNVTLDPRTCIFCHLDAIFQVARTKKNGKKKHDHFDHISKMTVDQKLIYVFVELFSNYTHVETKFNDVFSADHVNAFLTKYLPRSVPSKTISGVQLKTLEKLLRKVVAVYTANGLISPEEKNTFHEELLSTREIKDQYNATRQEIATKSPDGAWLDTTAIISPEIYLRDMRAEWDNPDMLHLSTFEHDLAENIRRSIAAMLRKNPGMTLGNADRLTCACGWLAKYAKMIAKALIDYKKPLNKYHLLFFTNLFTPVNREFIIQNGLHLFPTDTAHLVSDLAHEHLVKDCTRCNFKCFHAEEEPTVPGERLGKRYLETTLF
ncbi:MAG TPA: hypothetical protein VKM55_15095 [Candidatus Lokiarchaeia archaeon]|nr:hypothetical protein [Candidatus Lokiarchaeia archaeon]